LKESVGGGDEWHRVVAPFLFHLIFLPAIETPKSYGEDSIEISPKWRKGRIFIFGFQISSLIFVLFFFFFVIVSFLPSRPNLS
jgi:hypothetical protein